MGRVGQVGSVVTSEQASGERLTSVEGRLVIREVVYRTLTVENRCRPRRMREHLCQHINRIDQSARGEINRSTSAADRLRRLVGPPHPPNSQSRFKPVRLTLPPSTFSNVFITSRTLDWISSLLIPAAAAYPRAPTGEAEGKVRAARKAMGRAIAIEREARRAGRTERSMAAVGWVGVVSDDERK